MHKWIGYGKTMKNLYVVGKKKSSKHRVLTRILKIVWVKCFFRKKFGVLPYFEIGVKLSKFGVNENSELYSTAPL